MKFLNEKRLLMISGLIVLYFSGLYFIYIYEINHVLIGVFGELLTIPFLLAQVFFLVIGIIWLIRRQNHKPYRTVFSVILLSLCSYLTVGSIFLEYHPIEPLFRLFV